METLKFKTIRFRGVSKETNLIVEGGYRHITRKCDMHSITDDENQIHEIYRESLEMYNEYDQIQWHKV